RRRHPRVGDDDAALGARDRAGGGQRGGYRRAGRLCRHRVVSGVRGRFAPFVALEIRSRWEDVGPVTLCAAIDIGSNTTRLLVAEPVDGQLKKVMEQRAYTRIGKAVDKKGRVTAEKIEEVGEVVATQVRLAKEMGATEIRAVATAAVREARNCEEVAEAVGAAAGVPIEVLPEEEEGRLSFIGATKTL